MNVEKDQELSNAKARIEDLEVLAASRQKEVDLKSSLLNSVFLNIQMCLNWKKLKRPI